MEEQTDNQHDTSHPLILGSHENNEYTVPRNAPCLEYKDRDDTLLQNEDILLHIVS